MVYYSRRSWVLGIFLWGIIGFSYYHVGVDRLGLLDFFILSFVSILWFGLRYEIKEGSLLIKIGPFKIYTISIGEIISINRSYNPLSSPAVSLKRIKIDFKKSSVLISPSKERDFIQNLKEINPDIYCGISWKEENESILARFVYSIL
ncbi:PH domain-containing protein [Ekhidna sp.]|uniref:PH domain-containing protein n=1 Tax=Ekhidna sp. TaxID=2608089 RepID=UPI003515B5FF